MSEEAAQKSAGFHGDEPLGTIGLGIGTACPEGGFDEIARRSAALVRVW